MGGEWPRAPSPANDWPALHILDYVRVARLMTHSLGALVVEAAEGARVTVKRLAVSNKGWDLTPLGAGAEAPDWVRIRGFTCARHEARMLTFGPGEHVVEE